MEGYSQSTFSWETSRVQHLRPQQCIIHVRRLSNRDVLRQEQNEGFAFKSNMSPSFRNYIDRTSDETHARE